MVVLAACVPVPPEDTKLRVALLPILDVIPVFIAEQNGYFAAQGIQVESIPVKSAQERDVLIQTGQADGMVADLIAVGLFNKEKAKVKAVYTARRAYPEAPMLRILAGPGTAIATPADLRGVPIAISQNTVIEYVTYRILEGEGLRRDEIVIQEVSAIPVRFEQLMNGNVPAATLPDPLAQGALAAGARLVADDTRYAGLSQSVLAFTEAALQSKPATIRKFLLAWRQAVDELNAHPDRYRALLIEKGRVPEAIQDSYQMPPFPGPGVPTEEEIADAVRWLQEKGLVSRSLTYAEMVDASFLPR
jgi:NitT/TauT family transport system substrate-binding protein